jgi:hypothetical protein
MDPRCSEICLWIDGKRYRCRKESGHDGYHAVPKEIADRDRAAFDQPTPDKPMDDVSKLVAPIRARAEKAAKGPWHVHEGDLVTADHKDVFLDWEKGDDEGNSIGPDTVFICNAQPDVITLCDALESVAKENAKLKEAEQGWIFTNQDFAAQFAAVAKERDALAQHSEWLNQILNETRDEMHKRMSGAEERRFRMIEERDELLRIIQDVPCTCAGPQYYGDPTKHLGSCAREYGVEQFIREKLNAK